MSFVITLTKIFFYKKDLEGSIPKYDTKEDEFKNMHFWVPSE
jgi:hypothetical protein